MELSFHTSVNSFLNKVLKAAESRTQRDHIEEVKSYWKTLIYCDPHQASRALSRLSQQSNHTQLQRKLYGVLEQKIIRHLANLGKSSLGKRRPIPGNYEQKLIQELLSSSL